MSRGSLVSVNSLPSSTRSGEARFWRLPAFLAFSLILLWASPSAAILDDAFDFHCSGDVKSFYFSVFPYESPFMPDEPFGQAVVDFRLKFDAIYSSWVRLDFHHQVTSSTLSLADGVVGGAFSIFPAQGERGLPQSLRMDWSLSDEAAHRIGGRVDRLSLSLRASRLHLNLGRQAISFGRAYFFTPLDLVAPFTPLVVDREYKPGVDAVRLDGYFGIAGQITAVAAYAGSWESEGLLFAVRAGNTFAGFDFAFFGAAIRRDAVLGLESSGALGSVSVRAEGTYTLPSGDEPFVRLVAGADHLLVGGRLSVSGEVYMQSIGASSPSGLFDFAMSERVMRSEIWTMGRYYAAANANFELTPLVHISGFGVVNLADQSLLVGPGLEWSVADSARLYAGAYMGLGKRPGGPLGIEPGSEFGLYPSTAQMGLSVYF